MQKAIPQKEGYVKNPLTVTGFLCFATLFCFIVFGNSLTFNLGERLPIKVAELMLIITAVPLVLRQFLLPVINGKKVFSKPITVLLVWVGVSIFLSIISFFRYSISFSSFFSGFLYLLRFVLVVVVAYLMVQYFKDRYSVKKLFSFMIKCYVIVCIIGIFQWIFFPIANDWYSLFYKIGVYFPDADPHKGRLVSTYFDPNYLASCLIIPISIILYSFDRDVINGEDLRLANVVNYLVGFFFFAVIILLTESRSGILGVGVLFFLYILFNAVSRRGVNLTVTLLLLAFCILVLILVFFSNISVFVRIREIFDDPSAQARFNNWKKSFTLIKDTDYMGVGYNLLGGYLESIGQEPSAATGYGLDSSLLLITVTTGIIGIILFLTHYFSLSFGGKIPKPFRAIIIAALVMCNTNNLLFYGLWVMPFYFLIFTGDTITSGKEH